MSELKPCPFCGGEAEAHEVTFPYHYWDVLCDGECFDHFCEKPTKAEAIEAWNTRAERTCRMELTDLSSGSAYHDVWLCCACGDQVEQHTVMGKSEPPNYCPNCGARVTPKNSETTPKVVSE